MPSKPKKRGPPKKDVPMDIVEALCQFNPTVQQVLEGLRLNGCFIGQDKLYREIKRVHGVSFAEFRDKKTDATRLKLVQKAAQMALGGHATMLIFCLKNMCGWKDRNEVTAPPPPDKTEPQMTTEERRARIKELEARARELGDD